MLRGGGATRSTAERHRGPGGGRLDTELRSGGLLVRAADVQLWPSIRGADRPDTPRGAVEAWVRPKQVTHFTPV